MSVVTLFSSPERLIPSCSHYLFDTCTRSCCSASLHNLQNQPHRNVLHKLILYPSNIHIYLFQYFLPNHLPQGGGVLPDSIGSYLKLLACHLVGHPMVEYPQLPINMGVVTHVYDPKRRYFWTKDSNKLPNDHSSDPSVPRFLEIWYHFSLAFKSLDTTTGKSLSLAVKSQSRYLNNARLVSEHS